MADMSYASPKPPPNDVRLTVRVSPELAARLELLAAHCGQGRSQFIRTSVALADATMALGNLRAREARGPLPPEARHAKKLARRRLADLGATLMPKALPPLH
jgi:glutathione S-transferase